MTRSRHAKKKPAVPLSVIFTTTATLEDAKRISRALVARGLVACGSILPNVTSLYKWKGVEEESSECLVMLKTRTALAQEVMKELRKLHTYEVPEMIVLDASAAFKPYAAWVKEVTAAASARKKI